MLVSEIPIDIALSDLYEHQILLWINNYLILNYHKYIWNLSNINVHNETSYYRYYRYYKWRLLEIGVYSLSKISIRSLHEAKSYLCKSIRYKEDPFDNDYLAATSEMNDTIKNDIRDVYTEIFIVTHDKFIFVVEVVIHESIPDTCYMYLIRKQLIVKVIKSVRIENDQNITNALLMNMVSNLLSNDIDSTNFELLSETFKDEWLNLLAAIELMYCHRIYLR